MTASKMKVDPIISKLPKLKKNIVREILVSESDKLEVTRSLLNILYNLVRVGSIPVSALQKEFLDQNSSLVYQLIGKSRSLAWKKGALEDNIPLVITIAASYPNIAGWNSVTSL